MFSASRALVKRTIPQFQRLVSNTVFSNHRLPRPYCTKNNINSSSEQLGSVVPKKMQMIYTCKVIKRIL